MPSMVGTAAPTSDPTTSPTAAPTSPAPTAPTFSPTQQPTSTPTLSPTRGPTLTPTLLPSMAPSDTTLAPTTAKPSLWPTGVPSTALPTALPTTMQPTPHRLAHPKKPSSHSSGCAERCAATQRCPHGSRCVNKCCVASIEAEPLESTLPNWAISHACPPDCPPAHSPAKQHKFKKFSVWAQSRSSGPTTHFRRATAQTTKSTGRHASRLHLASEAGANEAATAVHDATSHERLPYWLKRMRSRVREAGFDLKKRQ
jgi:hypothetical protein